MTKSAFSIEKLQKKSVRTVWGMMQNRLTSPLSSSRSIVGSFYFKHFKHLSYMCREHNLVTVNQILKAIR